MGWFDLFSTTKAVDKAADGLYNGIDKAFYTDEEKKADFKEVMQIKIKMLEALHPFKLIQRHIALVFTYNFFAILWVAIITGLWEKSKYGTTEYLELILKVGTALNIGWAMVAIVTFYFGGGLAESFKRTKKE